MQCPRCDSRVDDDASYCPECGVEIDAHEERAQRGSDGSSRRRAAGDDEGSQTTRNRTQRGGEGSGRERRQQSRTDAGQSVATNSITESRGAAEIPFQQGAIVGVGAFVLNYIITFLLLRVEVSSQGGDISQLHKYAGWAMYNAHNVKIGTPYGSSFSWLENVYSGGGTTIPKLLYYVLPVLVLGAAGYYVAKNASLGPGPQTAQDAAKAGATIATGYAALAVVGSVAVFTISGDAGQGATLKPDLMKTILLMGLAYPAVVGGAGGYLSSQ